MEPFREERSSISLQVAHNAMDDIILGFFSVVGAAYMLIKIYVISTFKLCS
jgi:hypothetical protein